MFSVAIRDEFRKLQSQGVKKCCYCHQVKPHSEFYKDTGKRDKRRSGCKICQSLRERTPEYRKKTNLRKRIAFKKNRKRYYQLLELAKTPKGIARRTLRNAVGSGKISKPKICSICNEHKILHGHHKDYSKPLEVIWVCALCHTKLHKENRCLIN